MVYQDPRNFYWQVQVELQVEDHHFLLSLSVPEALRMSSSEYRCTPFLTEAAAYLAAFGDALAPNMLVKVF